MHPGRARQKRRQRALAGSHACETAAVRLCLLPKPAIHERGPKPQRTQPLFLPANQPTSSAASRAKKGPAPPTRPRTAWASRMLGLKKADTWEERGRRGVPDVSPCEGQASILQRPPSPLPAPQESAWTDALHRVAARPASVQCA